jgi:hypothetical protein
MNNYTIGGETSNAAIWVNAHSIFVFNTLQPINKMYLAGVNAKLISGKTERIDWAALRRVPSIETLHGTPLGARTKYSAVLRPVGTPDHL